MADWWKCQSGSNFQKNCFTVVAVNKFTGAGKTWSWRKQRCVKLYFSALILSHHFGSGRSRQKLKSILDENRFAAILDSVQPLLVLPRQHHRTAHEFANYADWAKPNINLQSCVTVTKCSNVFPCSPQREKWRFGVTEQEKTAEASFFRKKVKKLACAVFSCSATPNIHFSRCCEHGKTQDCKSIFGFAQPA